MKNLSFCCYYSFSIFSSIHQQLTTQKCMLIVSIDLLVQMFHSNNKKKTKREHICVWQNESKMSICSFLWLLYCFDGRENKNNKKPVEQLLFCLQGRFEKGFHVTTRTRTITTKRQNRTKEKTRRKKKRSNNNVNLLQSFLKWLFCF